MFYWSREARGSNAEVGYLIVQNGDIYPVEVKSGTGDSLRSLHLILKKYPNCPQGLVLYSGTYNTIEEQKLTLMPLYCTASIGDKQPTVVLKITDKKTVQSLLFSLPKSIAGNAAIAEAFCLSLAWLYTAVMAGEP